MNFNEKQIISLLKIGMDKSLNELMIEAKRKKATEEETKDLLFLALSSLGLFVQ